VVVGVDAPPTTMDPMGSSADSDYSVWHNIFEGLVKRVGAEGDIKPALATEWEQVDEVTYRFWLREDVEFHNGNPFTWEDVKFTFERLADPDVSRHLEFGNLVTSVETVDGDPWVIDITLSEPTPYFINNLHQIPAIMDKESTEDRSEGEISSNPIGTGPYKFAEWERDAYLALEANEDYWGETPPIKHAELRPIEDSSTRFSALSAGEIDLMVGVPIDLYETVEEDPDTRVVTRPSRRCIFLPIGNDEDLPTSDIRVREAMYRAINEEEIIEEIMGGHATPAAQIPDPSTSGQNPDIERLDYDPEKARQLLEEAGYGDGFSIELTVPHDRYVKDAEIGTAIVSYLAKVGIEAELRAVPQAMLWPMVENHELDFHLYGWFDGAYSFARTASKVLHTPDPDMGYGGNNGTAMSYPELDQQLRDAMKIDDLEEREEAIQEVNKAYAEKIAYIPLHFQEQIYAVQEGTGLNFTPRPDRWVQFWEMSYSE
ncbi:MAG: ABC transporter substrate-binding protein, partial [Candidatus Acetothermia bacterium]